MSSQPIYIEPENTKDLLMKLTEAIQEASSTLQLFQVWGLGGVGKTTLTREIKKQFKDGCQIAEVSFGLDLGLQSPIDLMTKLFEQFKPVKPLGLLHRGLKAFTKEETFIALWEKYQETIHKLETQPLEGKPSADNEQNIVKLKKLINKSVAFISQTADPTLGVGSAILGNAAEEAVNVAVMLLSEKDRVKNFLNEHKATKTKKQLIELMLNPLTHLTNAFVKDLIKLSQEKPIIILLDTYEKAPSEIDMWLCQHLLGSLDLKSHKIFVFIAGRYSLLKTEHWRKLYQERNLLYEIKLERFNYDQTVAYLKPLGITQEDEVQKIFQKTKGLPYYLDWIRRQKMTGRNLDFSQGNQEIIMLLMQGLTTQQKKILELTACCRWFNQDIINHLIQEVEDNTVTNGDSCFEWLKKQDFIEIAQGHYRLDDVARDTFRQSLLQDSINNFYETHSKLASYFKILCNKIVPEDRPEHVKYENAVWRKNQAESLYHSFFSEQDACQLEFISNIFIGRYLDQYDVITIPVEAIIAESNIEENIFLSATTRNFLTKVAPVSLHAPILFDENRFQKIIDEIVTDNSLNPSELNKVQPFISKIKTKTKEGISICFSKIDSLIGLAKFSALFFKSKTLDNDQRLHLLQQAKTIAEQISSSHYFEFSSKLFDDTIGSELVILGYYQEALSCFDKALTFNQGSFTAWCNRATALTYLNRYKEAIPSYEKALQIKSDYRVWYNRAVALSSVNKPEDALSSYDHALQIDPNNNDVLFNRGSLLIELERYEEALIDYDKAVKVKPDDYSSWYNRGFILDTLGRYTEATSSYKNVLKIKPLYQDAWLRMGISLAHSGEYEESIEAFKKALESDPNNDEILYNLGTSQLHLGLFEESLKNFESALKINPNNHDALFNHGLVLADLGRFEESLSSLDLILIEEADSSLVWYKHGQILTALGRYEDAVRSYDKALELDSKDYLCWYYRGNALAELEKNEEALISYINAATINTNCYEAWYNHGFILFGLEQYEKAIESFDHVLEINPNTVNAWQNRGDALYYLNRYEEALESYDRVIQITPNFYEAWLNRSLTLKNLDNIQEALSNIDKAIEINPKFHRAWFEKALIYSELENYQQALEAYDELLKINLEDYNTWFNRANILVNLGQYEEALTSFDKASSIKPDDYEVWSCHGSLLKDLERYEEAIASYDRVLAIEPDDYESWYYRGEALYRLGKLEDAIESCKKALDVNSELGEVWAALAITLNDLGKYEEAISSYNKALKLKPDNHEHWYSLGNIFAILTKNEEAIESYSKAIKINPNSGEAFHKLGLIFMITQRYEEALENYDKALEITPNNYNVWYSRANCCMAKTFLLPFSDSDTFIKNWQEVLRSVSNFENHPELMNKWCEILSDTLIAIINSTDKKTDILEPIQMLITKSGLEEKLFPLSYAIKCIALGKYELPEEFSSSLKVSIISIINKIQQVS